jgi:hypothetical protein
MRDWRQIVEANLQASARTFGDADSVMAELAAHLEETYEAGREQGLTEGAARELALQEVRDWHDLAEEISRAKAEENRMNQRTRSLWIPAMTNVIVAPGLLMILQKLAVQPRVLWIGDMAMVLYLPWLIALPIFGALGAFLARRAHARSLSRLIVGISPALAVLGAFALVLPVGLVVDHQRLSSFPFAYFGLTIFNWVVLPALVLLLGTLPFLRETNTPERSEA